MMPEDVLQDKIKATAYFILDKIKGQKPAILKDSWWQEKIINWSLNNSEFKNNIFYFLDVLPSLQSDKQIVEHMKEHFSSEDNETRDFLNLNPNSKVSSISAKLAYKAFKKNIESMLMHLIAGKDLEEAIASINSLWTEKNIDFTAEILTKKTLSQKEAKEYQQKCITLLQILSAEAKNWPNYSEKSQVSINIKPSLLCANFDLSDFEKTLEGILNNLRPILRQAKALNAEIIIDTEGYTHKSLILEAFKRLLDEDEFKNYEQIGIVLYSYFLSSEEELKDLLSWLKKRKRKVKICLNEGAKWLQEQAKAKNLCLGETTFTSKEECEANFEKLNKLLFDNIDKVESTLSTQNIRQVIFAIELAKEMALEKDAFTFEMLYAATEPIADLLVEMGYKVKNHAVLADEKKAMSHLLSCLNSIISEDSVLRKTFADNVDIDELFKIPEFKQENKTSSGIFDFTRKEVREKFESTKKAIKDKYFSRKFGLIIHGKEIGTEAWQESINPRNPEEIVGISALANQDDIEYAIESAKQAFPIWSAHGFKERAEYLKKIAEVLKRRKYEFAALISYESGKTCQEAADELIEAIYFCEFYAKEAMRLEETNNGTSFIDSHIQEIHQAKGVGAIICPGSSGLSIPINMLAAAIVTGNTVVIKPSKDAPITLANFMQVLKEVNLPAGVVNFIPTQGQENIDYIIKHPNLRFITFTGSSKNGLHILEEANKMQNKQTAPKSVFCAMSGSNSIILDKDADLDEAIPAIIESAFAFQGQNCFSVSKLIVLEDIYEEFMGRFVEALKSVKAGPMINKNKAKELFEYFASIKEDCEMIFEGMTESNDYYFPIKVFKNSTEREALIKEELLGPILEIIKVQNFDEALNLANKSKYALAGGLFSRNLQNIKRAYLDFEVGNLYINRKTSTLHLKANSFGGLKLSGNGIKAGNLNYLLHFMRSKTVNENISRDGFMPINS